MSTVFVDLIEMKPRKQRDDESNEDYSAYIETSFQPWRWVAKNAGNQKKLARSSERYFNREDALAAAEQVFSAATTVFKREAEMGNVLLRQGQAQ